MLFSNFLWDKTIYLGGELMKIQDVNNSNLQKFPENVKIHLVSPSPGMWLSGHGCWETLLAKLGHLEDSHSLRILEKAYQLRCLDEALINWAPWRQHSLTCWAAHRLCNGLQSPSFHELCWDGRWWCICPWVIYAPINNLIKLICSSIRLWWSLSVAGSLSVHIFPRNSVSRQHSTQEGRQYSYKPELKTWPFTEH